MTNPLGSKLTTVRYTKVNTKGYTVKGLSLYLLIRYADEWQICNAERSKRMFNAFNSIASAVSVVTYVGDKRFTLTPTKLMYLTVTGEWPVLLLNDHTMSSWLFFTLHGRLVVSELIDLNHCHSVKTLVIASNIGKHVTICGIHHFHTVNTQKH